MPIRKNKFGPPRLGGRSQHGTRRQVNRDGPARPFLEHKRPVQFSQPREKVVRDEETWEYRPASGRDG